MRIFTNSSSRCSERILSASHDPNKYSASIVFKLKDFFEKNKVSFYARQEVGYSEKVTETSVLCIKDNKLTFRYDMTGKVIAMGILDKDSKIKNATVYTYDVFDSIYRLLKKNQDTSFQILYPIYKILKKKGRKPNPDKSFTLKGEFSHYNVNKNNVCYINTLSDEHVNFKNIVLIYEEFYKGKAEEGNHWSKSYNLTGGFAIIENIWRETKRSYAGTSYSTVLRRVGDILSPEEKLFLNNYKKMRD